MSGRPLIPLSPLHTVVKGRGVAWTQAHRHDSVERQPEDDGWGALEQRQAEREVWRPQTTVRDEQVRTLISRNDSPDIGFDQSINPYRGCEHGCVYCYARPSHAWLGLSPGLDFETQLVAKVNAVDCLRAELARPGHVPSPIAVGTITDAYQPIERERGLTSGLLQLLGECAHPYSVITKSAGVERDLDLIAPMAAAGRAMVHVSLTTLDPLLARRLEPRAAAPQRRLQTIRRLSEAGVPVGVSVSPLIPFLNEPELERILAAAREAGARHAFGIVLRLPWEVNPIFQQWLQQHYPERAERVMARVREMRGGADNDARFGLRMKGQGVWAELLRQRLRKACARLGLSGERLPLDGRAFRPPPRPQRPGSRPMSSGVVPQPQADPSPQFTLF